MLVPFVNRFVSLDLVFMLLFLVRDFPFEGRGIGKNAMGLRVVDRATGKAPSLWQCFQRNIILIAPYAISQLIASVARLIRLGFIDTFLTWVVNIIGMVYVVIVLPLEAYRAYGRADGMRLGDQIAGTEIVESNMDFSKPLPRDK